MRLRLPRFALGRRVNPDADACALTAWQHSSGDADYQRRLQQCGPDAADDEAGRSRAASRLARRRWTLPEGVRRLQAKVLRGME